MARVWQVAVIGALDDAEAQVFRMPERIEPVSLRHANTPERKMRTRPHFAPEHGEVVHDVHAQHADRVHTAGHVDQLSTVALRIVDELRNDVVVRDEMSAAGDEETGADRGFRGGAGLDDLDLDDAVGVTAKDDGRRDVSLLREEAPGRGERSGQKE